MRIRTTNCIWFIFLILCFFTSLFIFNKLLSQVLFRLPAMPDSPIELDICGGEQLSFQSYFLKSPMQRGKNFSCALVSLLDKWKISDKFAYSQEQIIPQDVVFITYSSSNHFPEARKSLMMARNEFQNKIIFFDLGLSPSEVAELKNVCNLEVRKFRFEAYPMHVKTLMGYHFKPIIIAEIFSEYPAYWIMDTSVRFFDTVKFIGDFYQNITSGRIESFALRHGSGHSIFATTKEGMYNYLPMDLSLAKETDMVDANTMFVHRSNFSREATKWNVLCALTKDCMAPDRSNVNCGFNNDRYNQYAGCHRYDQSSINIIVTNMLERDGFARRNRLVDDSMRNFSTVSRGDTSGAKLNIPCPSRIIV